MEDKYLDIAKNLVLSSIDKKSFAVFLFGSRAIGKQSRTADIDIGVLGEMPFPDKEIALLKDKLEESIVPFNVDIVDFFNVDPKFKKIALKQVEVLNLPKSINLDLTP